MGAALVMFALSLAGLGYSVQTLAAHLRSERAHRRYREDSLRRVWDALAAAHE